MHAVRDADPVMAEINITPFTDVLLVLLIIFMILAALVAPPGFEKQLGSPGDGAAPKALARPIDVLVNEAGTIYVDGRRSDVRRVYADLRNAALVHGRRHVALTADVRAPYGEIVRILDAARMAKLDDVGFVTS